MAIKVSAPIRIDFSGWADSPPFVDDYGGFILNAAINYRVSTSIRVELKFLQRKVFLNLVGWGALHH